MPKVDGVGYGECTPMKLEHFSKIISMHLAVTRAVLRKNIALYRQCYRYVELTAGKGLYPDGQEGTPILFLQQAESNEFEIPYRADFVELSSKNLTELEEEVNRQKQGKNWRATDIHYHLGKYQTIVPSLFSDKDGTELGLAFVDPSGDAPDLEALCHLVSVRPKMELLIYLSSTNIKRIIQYTGKRLNDYLDQIGKRYWLVRSPFAWDRLQWTFLLGSNTDLFKDYKRISFFRLDSENGQEILRKLNLTEKEQRQGLQPKLL